MRIALLIAAVAAAALAGDPIPADTEVKTTASGLSWCVLRAGPEGAAPVKPGDRLLVHGGCWKASGEQTRATWAVDDPEILQIGPGLQPAWLGEALQAMTVGSRCKFTIPGERLAREPYRGNAGPEGIVVVFDIVEALVAPPFPALDPAAVKASESGLKAQIIREGTGTAPADGQICELKATCWDPGGRMVFTTIGGPSPLQVEVSSPMCAFFKEACQMLKPGGLGHFDVPGKLCAEIGIPPTQPTIWELEMVRTLAPLPLPAFAMPEEGKLTKTSSGLGYEVVREGTGAPVVREGRVRVHYAGWLTDGTLFDASFSRGAPAVFPVGVLIPGWIEGLCLMKEGGICRFVVPANLAYGARAAGKIPPNSTLVFHVEVVHVLEPR